jgi:hypothetical protein
MLLAQTLEPDDAEYAVREILGQLDLPRNLRRHSAGVVHCNQAFVESGALKALCDRLPFPVLGFNTYLHASSLGLVDSMLMSAAVLTSDTVSFAAGLSAPMAPDMRGAAASMYVETENRLGARPAAGLVYGPILPGLASGEILTAAIDEASDGVPLFGGLPADFTSVMRDPRVIFNGEAYRDRAGIILVQGEVSPRFRVYPVSAHRMIRQKAIITGARGNIVTRVNDMPVVEFMESLGLCFEGRVTGPITIPIFISGSGEGAEPVIRVILDQTAEGALILSGDAPVDSTLGLGAIDERHILGGIRHAAGLMRGFPPDVSLLYSCLSRNVVLGFSYTAEADLLRRELEGIAAPYVFSYVGGEICPVPGADGKLVNRFHNMALATFSF